jgi:hypothetical protein
MLLEPLKHDTTERPRSVPVCYPNNPLERSHQLSKMTFCRCVRLKSGR